MEVFLGILIPFLGTSLGAGAVFLMKNELNDKLEKILLGFAAGVMVAASVWSLIIPSIEMAEEQNVIAWIPASVGIILGIFAGNVFLKILWSSMSDSMDVITIISLKSYLWAALITLGVIIFSGLGIGGRIRSIPLVEALKGVE